MKKLFAIVSLATVVLFTSSCITNEESEGVKQMRLGQAALLNAMANAQTIAATADASLKAAQTALAQAQADYEQAQIALVNAQAKAAELKNTATEEENRHVAAMNALQEELAAAQSEADKARIQQEMAEAEAAHNQKMAEYAEQIAQLENDAKIQAMQAEMALLNAQKQLDDAQKNYEYQTALAAQEQDARLNELKAQGQQALVDGYNAAYTKWSNENMVINGIQGDIALLGFNLNNQKIADSSDVKTAQSNLDMANETLTSLQTDLTNAQAAVRNTDAIDEIIAGYEADLTSLSVDSLAKRIDMGIKYDLMNKALEMYNKAQTDYSEAYLALYSYPDGLDPAIQRAESDTTNAYNYYFVNLLWRHDSAGTFIDYTTYENAVMTEEGDANVNGVFPSLNDEADVERAKTESDKYRAAYNDAISNYNSLYSRWLTARNNYEVAQTTLNEKWDAYIEANNEYNLASNEYGKVASRISSVKMYIAQLTIYTDVAGKQLVADLETQIEQAQADVEFYQTAYDGALKSFNEQLPILQLNYDAYNQQINNLKERLADEQALLELYKADLDDWTAKIQVALSGN